MDNEKAQALIQVLKKIIDKINKLDVMAMTPMEALKFLFDLKKKVKGM